MVALPRFLVNFEPFNILAATLAFVKKLDPDQDRRNVRPDLDQTLLILILKVFLKKKR